jgi:predicted transposase YbfD/YdcC
LVQSAISGGGFAGGPSWVSPLSLAAGSEAVFDEPVGSLDLLARFAQVCDGRSDQGRDHPVGVVLTLAAGAVVAGMRSFSSIAGWVADVEADCLRALYGQVKALAGVPRPPSKATIWRVVTGADATVVDAVISAWLADRAAALQPGTVTAPGALHVDGKSLRGATATGRAAAIALALAAVDRAERELAGIEVKAEIRAAAEAAVAERGRLPGSDPRWDLRVAAAKAVLAAARADLSAARTRTGAGTPETTHEQASANPPAHLLAAMSTGGLVLAQTEVHAKTNEIPMFAELLDTLDITATVITADALHTQRAHADYLHRRGADFVFCVKANQAGLLATLEGLPWAQVPIGHRQSDRGHGRITARAIQILPAPAQLSFPHVQQVFRLHRHVEDLAGQPISDIDVLGVTSLPPARADAAEIAEHIRSHWGIETLHWIRDTCYREDQSTVRTRSGPRVMAALRNLAIGAHRLTGRHDITQATLWAARRPHRPFNILDINTRS